MKLTLYIRRSRTNPAKIEMWTRDITEPCYDSPRIINLGEDIKGSLDEIIKRCEDSGVIALGRRGDGRSETVKCAKRKDEPEMGREKHGMAR